MWYNVALAEAAAKRQDIFMYNRRSNRAEAYLDLCKALLERTEVPAGSPIVWWFYDEKTIQI